MHFLGFFFTTSDVKFAWRNKLLTKKILVDDWCDRAIVEYSNTRSHDIPIFNNERHVRHMIKTNIKKKSKSDELYI